MGDDGAAIRVEGLTKRFGKQLAVDKLSFEVPPGVVAGFVGPNGAGKSTTLRMLAGLVRPTAGSATVLGHDISKPAAYLHRVGALIEGPAFYRSLTGRENLELVARVGAHDPARIPAVLGEVRLAGREDDRYGTYSMGMKQRLGIAAARGPGARRAVRCSSKRSASNSSSSISHIPSSRRVKNSDRRIPTYVTRSVNNTHRRSLSAECGAVMGQVTPTAAVWSTLVEHDLVDELRLMVFPVALGSSKRLFCERAAQPSAEHKAARSIRPRPDSMNNESEHHGRAKPADGI